MNKILGFLKDQALRKTIEEAIAYADKLFSDIKNDKNNRYEEETCRVIILYIVSIIEAILLYVIKERGEKITTLVYKNPRELSKIKDVDYPNEKVVLAVQSKKIRADKEIGMQDLVHFMKSRKLMRIETVEEILEINNIRNTFHLNKPRTDIDVEVKKVEKAFALLLKIIEGAPKAIDYKSNN